MAPSCRFIPRRRPAQPPNPLETAANTRSPGRRPSTTISLRQELRGVGAPLGQRLQAARQHRPQIRSDLWELEERHLLGVSKNWPLGGWVFHHRVLLG